MKRHNYILLFSFLMLYGIEQVTAQITAVVPTVTYADNGSSIDVTVSIAYDEGANVEWMDGIQLTIGGNSAVADNWPVGGSGLGEASPFAVTLNLPYPAGYVQGSPLAATIDWVSDGYPDNTVETGTEATIATCTSGCTPPPPLCGAGTTSILEDNFSAGGQLTWTFNILAGTDNWLIGDGAAFGGNFANLDGDNLFFDDDQLGSSSPDDAAEVISPSADLTCYSTVNLSFDYIYNDINATDFLAVDVWDGAAWVNVLNQTTDQTTWLNFSLDVSAYINDDFQVRFTYDDGDDWSWYAAVDNFALCGTTTAPANDECAAAVALSVAADQASCVPTNGTNVGATDSGISWPTGCNGDLLSYAGGDVWYSVVVPTGCDDLVIETSDDGTGSTDTQIAVWDACNGTLIDCSDDAPSLGYFSKVVLPSTSLVPGSTIYIGVSEYFNDECGTFNICAYTQPAPAPANDACADAIALPAPDAGSCTTQTVVSNVGATPDGTMSCGVAADPIQNNTWYSLTIPATACAGHTLTIETSSDGSNTLTDTQLGVWDLCGGTELACDDDSGPSLYSLVTLLIGTDVNPGETIYITLDGYFSDCGTANICSYTTPPACPVIDHTPDVTSVCHGGDVTFTPGAACTLNGTDQVADLYVYIDPATGQPGTAPAPLTIAPGTQGSQMATLHPDWLLLALDGDCGTPLVGTLINTGCLPVNASLAIVTYNYVLDSDCDGNPSEYDGCAMLPFTITVYPDPADFEVVTTPGICGTAPTATLQLMDGTVCNTQTGTVPTCVAAPALNYTFNVNTGAPAACAAFTLSGTATSTCANCFNFGIFDPCVCNNDATTLTNGTFGETVAVWNDANNNGLLNAGEGLPAGQTWTVSAQTGATGAAVGTALTYGVIPANNPNGISGYYIQFSHVDAVGYTMSVEGPAAPGTAGNSTLNQAATCTYPNPSLTIAGSPFCLDAAAITLAGTIPNGANTAATPYSGPGVSGSTFTPATAGLGTHTITYNYDPAGNTTNQCLQPVTTTVTVIDCAVPCNAVNGTPTFNP
jgi:hypothetical protein